MVRGVFLVHPRCWRYFLYYHILRFRMFVTASIGVLLQPPARHLGPTWCFRGFSSPMLGEDCVQSNNWVGIAREGRLIGQNVV